MLPKLDTSRFARITSSLCHSTVKSQGPLVVVLGSNDIASAVALRLYRQGLSVLMVESRAAVVTRRGQSFADAVFDGVATLDGVTVNRVDHLASWWGLGERTLALTTQALDRVLAWQRPAFLVDARMRKRDIAPDRRGLAELTIGLGPSFVAGRNVDWAVETAWGPRLGAIIESGPTMPLSGEPRPIGGYGRERYVYASRAGLFHSNARIGQEVVAGQVVGQLDGIPVATRVAGVIRGLARDSIPVGIGTKIVEVVPLGCPVTGISERPGKIANAASDLLGRLV